jgi:hypothetical protein
MGSVIAAKDFGTAQCTLLFARLRVSPNDEESGTVEKKMAF